MCQICGCILTYCFYAVKKKKSNNKPLTDYAVSKTSYPDIVFNLCISITIITPRTFSLFYLFLVSILADYINKNTQLSVCFYIF